MNKGKTSLYPSLYRLCSLLGIEGNIRDQASGPTLQLQKENRLISKKFEKISCFVSIFQHTLKVVQIIQASTSIQKNIRPWSWHKQANNRSTKINKTLNSKREGYSWLIEF